MTVRVDQSGGVTTVTIDRASKKNAINLAVREEVVATFLSIEKDDQVRAVVLTGAGDDFSAGADISEMGGGGVAGSIGRMRSVHDMMRAIALCDKPVIAAVNGICAGVAWSMALACDFVIVGNSASFRFAFRQIGLAPDGASPFMLMQYVGLQQAKELIYTGRSLSGTEAVSIGLALRVVPDDSLATEAEAFAKALASGPTLAMTRAKRMFRAATTQNFEQALATEADIQPMIAQSEDYAEGLAAFRERRPPIFRGR